MGDSVFTTVLVERGRAFAWLRHLRRLEASSRALGLPEVEAEFATECAREALASVDGERLRLRLVWGRADGGGGLLTAQVSSLSDVAGRGARLVTSSVRRTSSGALGNHKTTAYADNLLAAAEARRAGGDEALLLTDDGQVCEGAGSNVFIVVDGELLTPPLTAGCLPGIARELVLEHTGAREAPVSATDVERCSELFLTSSTREVQAVEYWRGPTRGPTQGPTQGGRGAAVRSWPESGPRTRAVQEAWRRIRGSDEEWYRLR